MSRYRSRTGAPIQPTSRPFATSSGAPPRAAAACLQHLAGEKFSELAGTNVRRHLDRFFRTPPDDFVSAPTGITRNAGTLRFALPPKATISGTGGQQCVCSNPAGGEGQPAQVAALCHLDGGPSTCHNKTAVPPTKTESLFPILFEMLISEGLGDSRCSNQEIFRAPTTVTPPWVATLVRPHPACGLGSFTR